MNKEEKESVAHLEWLLDEGILSSEDEPYIETVLNLIQSQEKIIDEMTSFLMTKDFDEDICVNNIINPQLCNEQLSNCKECIKEYFKKVVEENGDREKH